MNKTCARCEKTVYPTEELKCLDKVWHKGCFKCQECGMTLNMRTYKGYGKLPYCESHVPKAKHTTMAETPELKRIAENTKIQSNVKYHADFERSKGKFTQVADDPETLRIKQNSKIISNVAYHGDLEKKAQMEKQRQINENGEVVEIPPPENYHQQIDSYATEMLHTAPPSLPVKNHYQTPTQYQNRQSPTQYQQKAYPEPNRQYADQNRQYVDQNRQYVDQNRQYAEQRQHEQNRQYADQNRQFVDQNRQYVEQNRQYAEQNRHVEPTRQHLDQTRQHVEQTRQHVEQTRQNVEQTRQHVEQRQVIDQNRYEQYYRQEYQPKFEEYQNQYQGYPGQQPKIGRIQDYDPLSDGPRAPPNTQRASATLIYNSSSDKRGASQPQQQMSRQIGRVTDMDPMANEQPAPAPAHLNHNQRTYVAMYDYEANDSDEVSFREGDFISEITSAVEGWMTGQVVRTGRTGMLPANYVELAPTH